MAHHGVPGHDHSQCNIESGECFSLYSYIDNDHLICYNEEVNHSIKKVFKAFDRRSEKTDFVESSADEQLIITIPFTGLVKLKSLVIVGGDDGSSPKKLKLFANRDDIDFSNVEDLKATQELSLADNDFDGQLEYPVQVMKFGSCRCLTLFIPENYGADTTKIYFIGLKGEFTPSKRQPVITNYELVPLASKTKAPGEIQGSHTIS